MTESEYHRMKFLRREGRRNVFEFRCPCGSTGEIAVLIDAQTVTHDMCGTLIKQNKRYGKPPELVVVTSPIHPSWRR